jgi:hypothetical protein
MTIEEYFHIECVPPVLKRVPIYIHLDLSLTTDRTGISGGGVTGRKDIQSIDGKVISMPTFTHMFQLEVEAPRNDKISYSKIVAFICWLRKSGFNISRVSRDQFQSEYLAQELERQGFTVDKVSLDRTPDGYTALHSVICEERIDMLDAQALQDELIHLQRDLVTGKCDHPVGGGKDGADGMAGWIWNAIQHNESVPVSIKAKAAAMALVNNGMRTNDPKSNPILGRFGNYKKY